VKKLRDYIGVGLMVTGFIVMVGVTGRADYATATRTAFSDFKLLLGLGVGVMLMTVGGLLKGWLHW